MNRPDRRLALLLLLLIAPAVAFAHDDDDDDDDEGERTRPSAPVVATPESKQYASECGSCHLAFPPSMLPARSWRALLTQLGDHFGQNAEVDAATRTQLEAYLTQHAGRDVARPAPLRITALPWWRKEHDEVPAAVFQRKAVVGPANCAACHPRANQGAFGEKEVKIPRDAPAPR